MGKYEKKESKFRTVALIIAIVLTMAIILTALAVFVVPQVLTKLRSLQENPLSNQNETTSVSDTTVPSEGSSETSETVKTLDFPLVLANGSLEIESVLQFDGFNPDCGNMEGKNIAAITLKNLSGTYLDSATISLTTVNGAVLNFTVTDLPTGLPVMVFAQDNANVEANEVFTDASCDYTFNPEATMHDDKITVSVDGTLVTLQNNTSEELTNIVVYCHSTLGDQYFGGITYTYSIQTLPANGTAEVDALDCFLGLAEVVRVAFDEN